MKEGGKKKGGGKKEGPGERERERNQYAQHPGHAVLSTENRPLPTSKSRVPQKKKGPRSERYSSGGGGKTADKVAGISRPGSQATRKDIWKGGEGKGIARLKKPEVAPRKKARNPKAPQPRIQGRPR